MNRKRVLSDVQLKEVRDKHIPYVFGYGKLAKLYNCGESTIRDAVKYYHRA